MEDSTIQPSMPLVNKVEVSEPVLSKEDIMAKLSSNPNIQVKVKPKVCPVDPAELAQCEACQ
jgi:hypothetical protein